MLVLLILKVTFLRPLRRSVTLVDQLSGSDKECEADQPFQLATILNFLFCEILIGVPVTLCLISRALHVLQNLFHARNFAPFV